MSIQVSPLRQRMIDDMTIRNMMPGTQKVYIRAVKNFSLFFERSPDKLTFDDVRKYHLHLASRKLEAQTINQIATVYVDDEEPEPETLGESRRGTETMPRLAASIHARQSAKFLTKDELRGAAMRKLNVLRNSFDFAWMDAIHPWVTSRRK